MTRFKWTTLAGVLGAATFGAWALADSTPKSPDEIRNAVSQAISQRHPSETPDWWRSLGPQAPGVIISMFETTDRLYSRIRLEEGLGAFDDPQAVDFLKTQAQGSSEGVLRNAAIRSLGASQGAKEEDFISKFLQSSDAQTRFTAAQTLKRMGDARADGIVDRYLAQEKTPWIAAKVRGQGLPPAPSLTPAASSEDRLSPDLAGTWKGYWLTPRKNSDEIESVSATLQLELEDPLHVKGTLQLAAGRSTKAKSWRFANPAEGKGERFRGQLKPAQGSGESVEFQAEVLPERMLEIRVPRLGATLVVRHESKAASH